MASEKLQVILELVTGNYKREAREAATATGQISGAARTASGSMSSMVGSMRAFAGVAAAGALVKFGTDAVKAASNLEESMNAVNVVFGEAAGVITSFGETAAEAAGLAQSEFQQMATTLGSALINAGMSQDEAAKKTIELTQRAADMASVFNTTVPDALGAMQAALRGESDPIEKFGVTLTAAAVEAEAAALGFEKVGGEFDAQAKSAARLSLIMKQTSRVQGDFANTSDGLANKTRELQAKFTNMQAQLGTMLLPLLADLADALVDIVDESKPLIDALSVITDLYSGLTDALDELEESDNVFLKFLGEAGNMLFSFGGGLGAVAKGWESMSDAFGESLPKMVGAKGAVDELHDSWEGMPGVVGPTIELIDRQATAFSNAAKAADRQRTAMINLVNAQADLLDPLGNILRLQRESREAQERLAEVQADGTSTLEDLAVAAIEAEQAELRLQAAGAALTPEQIQAFALVLINDLGMSEAQALDTLEALNLLDGWSGTASFTLAMNTIASGGGGGGGGGNINSVWDEIGFDSGGIVPGPIGSRQMILAHGGETVLPTHKAGWGGGGGGMQIIVQSPMNDFRQDLQYATILASVTNLVEGL